MSKKAHAYLLEKTSERFPKLNSLIAQNRVQYLNKHKNSDLFLHLAKTVSGQQLSKKAASTIWGRILAMAERESVTLYNLCIPSAAASLRSCGLSRFKVKAIIEMREAFECGAISTDKLQSEDTSLIIGEITKLWGFGRWSADMTALFFFASPDVWSSEDAALRRGIRLLSQYEACEEREILEAATPFKSYLALHIWSGLDSGRLQNA